MSILLQPCSGKVAMEHFEDTIEDTIVNGVPLSYFDGKIETSDFSKLAELSSDTIITWGFVPNSKISEWKKLKEGDIVLFSAKKTFFYMGVVHSKIHNKKIAQSLWGYDDQNRTWEYIYFIKEGKSIQLPYKPEVLEYKSNHVIQGSQLLNDEKSTAMKEYLEDIEGSSFDENVVVPTEEEEKIFQRKIREPNSVEEAMAEINRISNEVKNEPVRERVKTAKMLIRNPKFARLVKEKAKYVCEICGEKPFMQKNGLPYAEAHHKSELSKTKIDNPNDMICVCPTCHKVVHFGTEEEELLMQEIN